MLWGRDIGSAESERGGDWARRSGCVRCSIVGLPPNVWIAMGEFDVNGVLTFRAVFSERLGEK